MTTTAQSSPIPAIILFGSPGSGKGTQARLLQNCLRGPHISTGDMLRSHIQAGDSIGNQAQALIKSGRLVPDEMVNELVKQRLQDSDCQAGIILDGYPRTTNQAQVLLGFMQSFGYQAAVVYLMVDYEVIVARLSGRRQCPVCGTLYNMKTNPPKVPGICDLEGAKLVTREDDRESVIRERLNQYEVQTRPLLDFFRQAGVPMLEIKAADASPEEISQEICRSLHSAGLMLTTNNGSR
ncbi:MAG: nucleoside monophosphate kinase [Acidobacteriaceae bacterium]|nr:nucleoside monophosphate kinase [Acidobacteriaceae bacterium]MBV9223391.1 nucleoside monophosphate kinase [Acidobacteriaceae bacterium]MBV9306425.1 nucleoside monophosphate kinase [Acidobacteriaceae bacterium]MBV9680058.1 nucleoside monophosphate kinase [Acidobacteriaceae bacterium]MBV9939101.1 nucleoside monophosphate kinase [Acidobacteriaceae bacterium]